MKPLALPVHHTAAAADDGLLEGQARVVALDGPRAWLAAVAPAVCGSCATRLTCGSAALAAKPASRWVVPATLPDGTPLQLGEVLRVGVARQVLAPAAVAAYLLPLGTALAAALAAQGAGDAGAATAAAVGLLAGALAARRLLRRWQAALQPVVIGHASSSSAGGC